MIKGIYNASRSMNAGMKNMNAVANNLANLNTTGYKRLVPFTEVMSEYAPGKVHQLTDFREGELVNTQNRLDMALNGDAFFAVQSDSGIRFTKNGKFNISDDGYLTTESGDRVLGHSGEINVTRFMLEKDPEVIINDSGQIQIGSNIVDKLLITKISDKQSLTHDQNSNFILREGNFGIADAADYKVMQGYLEASNVNPILEMESMIKTSKNYETSQKIVNYLDQSLSMAKEIGKV
ncbi:MAG: flagellar hook basal-body protein [Ignavibacteriae bacterium]|jgi:flagellar basal-body rod protein FlgG|nr:flagellar hook basal-body protein [Ignavibacteriota bacterium]NOG97162.1 flagellar hook basal-body protein [Ignavibacteriota bacterium]